jgi:deazaflavin-dependent oxidoreductase (nitroreductase family)
VSWRLPAPPSSGIWAAAAPVLHRAFKAFNRWFMLPAYRAGLGAWVSTPVGGWILVLRVTGRRSGLIRETPLNYLVDGGWVWVMAGFGERTQWYRNLLADPSVEVRLPGRRFTGTAEVVSDPAVRARMIPRLVRACGIPGMLVVPSPWTSPDETILDATAFVPLLRIRMRDGSAVEAGPDDPGGRAWVWRQGLVLLVSVVAWKLGGRVLCRR